MHIRVDLDYFIRDAKRVMWQRQAREALHTFNSADLEEIFKYYEELEAKQGLILYDVEAVLKAWGKGGIGKVQQAHGVQNFAGLTAIGIDFIPIGSEVLYKKIKMYSYRVEGNVHKVKPGCNPVGPDVQVDTNVLIPKMSTRAAVAAFFHKHPQYDGNDWIMSACDGETKGGKGATYTNDLDPGLLLNVDINVDLERQ